MAFIASAGTAQPGGYVQHASHDAQADGIDDLARRFRRWLCGIPDADRTGGTTGITAVGTFDTVLESFDFHDDTALTGTWNVRRLNGTTLRITDPGATNHDITVTWGTNIVANGADDQGTPMVLKILDTGADQLADGEGWDIEIIANGLPVATRWGTTRLDTQAGVNPTTTEYFPFTAYIYGRRSPSVDAVIDRHYIEIQPRREDDVNEFNIEFNPHQTPLGDDTIGRRALLNCWNETGASGARTMPYYFVADQKFAHIIANVNGLYYVASFGFLDTYGTPTQYPYPLMAGGMWVRGTTFDEQTGDVFNWPFGWSGAFTGNAGNRAMTYWSSNGLWAEAHGGTQGGNVGLGASGGQNLAAVSNASASVWPMRSLDAALNVDDMDQDDSSTPLGMSGPTTIATGFRGAVDGVTKVLLPLTVIERRTALPNLAPTANPIGTIPFIFWTNGFGTTAGSLITLGSTDYVLVANGFRVIEQGFVAIALE